MCILMQEDFSGILKVGLLGHIGLGFFFFFSFPFFSGLPLWHMEVPRLGIRSEVKLPAYATATAMLNPS